MALIWPVYEGREPTRGSPWAKIPLKDAIPLFDLEQADYVSDHEKTPRFGDQRKTFYLEGYKYLVIEVDPVEAKREKWKGGFYLSKIKPGEAFRRLIQHTFKSTLGENNVVRVDYAPATDSMGGDALRITVVIGPDSLQQLEGGTTLDALVKLRERLHDLHEERTPIVEYATEAELAQNAGH